MSRNRYEDTDVWPDNWKEWSASLILLTITIASVYAVIATGAFAALTADRTATVTTAGDASALLAFSPENDDYARLSNGQLEIAIDGSFASNGAVSWSGVNLDALTQIDDVFSITNQGGNAVSVWITTEGDNADVLGFFGESSDVETRTAIDSRRAAHRLDPGQSVTVSMKIDTRTENLEASDELVSEITVHADTDR